MVRVVISGRDETNSLEEVVIHFSTKRSDIVILKLYYKNGDVKVYKFLPFPLSRKYKVIIDSEESP